MTYAQRDRVEREDVIVEIEFDVRHHLYACYE